jgi:hypothetical protein
MSASTQAAPRQMSFGRMPSILAVLALIVVIAVAVSLVALSGAKTAAPATSPAKGAAPPVVIDHGWSSALYGQSVTNVPFYDHGWSKINEPGQSVTNVPFYDHDYSQKGTSSAPAAAPYTGPYINNGVFAVPAPIDRFDSSAVPAPYTGPYYYEGLTPHPVFDATVGPRFYGNGMTVYPLAPGTGAIGYPPAGQNGIVTSAPGYPVFGQSYFPKTIDSPYVAPRPRNQ